MVGCKWFLCIAVLAWTASGSFAAVQFYFGQLNGPEQQAWEASVDQIEAFYTTAANVGLAPELSGPPANGTNLGVSTLTYDSSQTGLSYGFSLHTLQPGATFLFGTHNMDNGLEVGVEPTYRDDDWKLQITSGSADLFGVAFVLIENDLDFGPDYVAVNGSAGLLGSSLVPEDNGRLFVGITSDDPIVELQFDEDTERDNIGFADFRFATPEPTMLSLIGLGVLLLRRRGNRTEVL